ncbi:sensor histidine kinase [Salinimicrobium sediminilitoris]|uniref:sensor histidine kinase n=1 Tax=Salinimicrobium sediminilitoris TaxID=2876715 RepID=UPI001E46116E|nr:ATP-binding protein [Salinimicrobium sediminilitoris]MCC8361267.1 two-component sensor histidine kinase [Salinimicrobium sediminilitoris]
MKKNNKTTSVWAKNEKLALALKLSEEALLAKDKEKKEITLQLAEAVKDLSIQIEEKERRAAELAEVNKQLAFQIQEKEKKKLELEEVNKELESFSYSVSHDLRTPLRAISGFSEVLIEDYAEHLDEEAQLYFSEIGRNVKKMGDLIDNLLEFSRLSKQDFFRVPVNIEDIIHKLVDEQKELEPERKTTVYVKDLPLIKGDKNMLKQLFFNLISNAFKYSSKREDSVIEIGSYPKGEQQVFYVKDNGAGFDARYYNKLFGVFQRLHSSNEFEGTGVGLAIVQKIVSKHDGEIWAEGKVGEGACFYVSLPAN